MFSVEFSSHKTYVFINICMYILNGIDRPTRAAELEYIMNDATAPNTTPISSDPTASGSGESRWEATAIQLPATTTPTT